MAVPIHEDILKSTVGWSAVSIVAADLVDASDKEARSRGMRMDRSSLRWSLVPGAGRLYFLTCRGLAR